MSDIKTLATEFKRIRDAHAELKKQLSALDAEWAQIEEKIKEHMIEEGVNSVSVEGVGRLTMATKSYLSVNAGNKPQFFEYLKESGNGGLLKLDVHTKTLGAFLDQHFKDLQEHYASSYGADPVEAREKALEFLNQKGASFFTEKQIRFSGE